ncbi:MAG: hypothetical protein O2955_15640 [Planctomycetota bacterium]|nr:hypothetical protein [Planctomycetota bacterium]MDA1213947.1 hypothetical protein [Planctomycetota bacterium]
MVDADPHELRVRYLSSEPLFQPPCYAAPALSNGLLYIRDEKQIACFELRNEKRVEINAAAHPRAR